MLITILERHQFGDKWPFVPDRLKIQISAGAVFTRYKGVKYNLNGIAENRKIGRDLDLKIWKKDEKNGCMMALGPIFVHLMKQGFI